jgi:hypothetical protein
MKFENEGKPFLWIVVNHCKTFLNKIGCFFDRNSLLK